MVRGESAMTDIFTIEKRREIMRKVKNKNTNIEMIIRKALFKKGYRFRVKNSLYGKPDIVFPSKKVAIFCDGDFWHGKTYKNDVNKYKEFWIKKIKINMQRDNKVNKVLKKEGWAVLRLWKSEILKNPAMCIKKIETAIDNT